MRSREDVAIAQAMQQHGGRNRAPERISGPPVAALPRPSGVAPMQNQQDNSVDCGAGLERAAALVKPPAG